MALPRRRSHEEPDDDCPTEMMRTRVMQREELASAVLPTAKPVRARPPSVKLRRTLATARPPSESQRAARAAATTEETVAQGKPRASVAPPRPEHEDTPTSTRLPSIAPMSIDLAPPSAPPPSAPPSFSTSAAAPFVEPQPSVELNIPPAEDTAPLPPTLPFVSSRSEAAPSSLPPWGDDSFIKRRPVPAASHTEAMRIAPVAAQLSARPAAPVQLTYRPLKLDLEARANDPGATQPSRRRRIEEASRRNWAAIAIAGGFIAGLLGSAVPLVSSMTAAPQLARVSRVHVSTPTPITVTTGAQAKGTEPAPELTTTADAPRKKARPLAGRAPATAPARAAHGDANATTARTPADAPPAVEAPAAVAPPPVVEAPAKAEAPKPDAKPADLNGRDLLTDGL